MSNPSPQQQFAPPAYPPAPQPQQSSGGGCWLYALIGCLGTLVLAVVLCGVGGWWLSKNAGKMIAAGIRTVIVAGINESQLDAQEKKEVIEQIDRVVNAYNAGKVKPEELEKLLNGLKDSPVLALIQVWGVEKMFLEPSGLTTEEKQAGHRSIERVFRGIVEKKIDHSEFQDAMPDSMRQQVEGGKGQPRTKPTDEEVKEFLANLKKLADDAEIPDEEFKIDVSDELKKDIDKLLEGKE
jgi:hypothetical protein